MSSSDRVRRSRNPAHGNLRLPPRRLHRRWLHGTEPPRTSAAPTDDDLLALIEGMGDRARLTPSTVQFSVTTPAPCFPAIAGLWINAPQYREVIEARGRRVDRTGRNRHQRPVRADRLASQRQHDSREEPLLGNGLGRGRGQHRPCRASHGRPTRPARSPCTKPAHWTRPSCRRRTSPPSRTIQRLARKFTFILQRAQHRLASRCDQAADG